MPHLFRAFFRLRRHGIALAAALALGAGLLASAPLMPVRAAEPPPRPLLAKGKPVDWWFVFKFNPSDGFIGCGPINGDRPCPFGGEPLTRQRFGQQFAFASSAGPKLMPGAGCLGAQLSDPVGATFDQVYNGDYFYVIWNDQFYADPPVCGHANSCGGRWGHSKGLLAWNDDGEGFIMQVSTPNWPGSGTSHIKRRSGNTLGCLTHNNLTANQHFFALKLNKSDLVNVLKALKLAHVVTDPDNRQIVFNGGPPDIRKMVDALREKPAKPPVPEDVLRATLSTSTPNDHVVLVAKPSYLFVPPWQMLSAVLSGASERAATWRNSKDIPSTKRSTKIRCWSPQITGKPGPVAIALTGEWNGKPIRLTQPLSHAKVGTASSGDEHYVVFGDLNQQGSIGPPTPCDSAQNGRGGLFFVLKNKELYDSLANLIDGNTAPLAKQ
jgi:hypothetical protein